MSKVNELIDMGEQLEKDRLEKLNTSKYKAYAARMRSFSGVKFQEWTSQSIFFLEEQKPSSLITENLKQKYNNLQDSTSYEFYEYLLGTLKAVKNQ
ncbi:hypothetical protein E2R51_02290 [Jeotgalibacillus sp. S-D1]|uniref:hypothetical protein n=1 Tax=Jeotgalibacillus sp. S-D1 TaxID=2552189 RepID=UPI0010593F8F|nr:hypothetical protein [Jeotgalibacillus sp. S-D1]TDL34566.1 hypothetical protein E2R51_02290 [Jeotgalibacillus sp. S-D1]